jgi:hypothetical protein
LQQEGQLVDSVPHVADLLRQRGREDLLGRRIMPLPARGITPCTLAALRRRVVRLEMGKRGWWVCLRCPWTSQTQGMGRMIEHCLGEIKQSVWHQAHGPDMPEQVAFLIAEYRKNGQRTAPCTDPVGKDTAMAMAAAGDAAAIRWCRFNQWIDFGPGVARQQLPAPLRPWDPVAAQEQHVVAALCSAMSFRGLSSPEWRVLFDHTSGNKYEPPQRRKVQTIVQAGTSSGPISFDVGVLCFYALCFRMTP